MKSKSQQAMYDQLLSTAAIPSITATSSTTTANGAGSGATTGAEGSQRRKSSLGALIRKHSFSNDKETRIKGIFLGNLEKTESRRKLSLFSQIALRVNL